MEQCKKCGTKLIENAKFCHMCGEKVIKNLFQSKQNDSNSLGECDKPKEAEEDIQNQKAEEYKIAITILGNHLEFQEDVIKLKNIRHKFHMFAEENINRYKEYAENYIKCFDDVYEYGIPFVTERICASIENGVKISKDLGMVDVDYERLAELYEKQIDYTTYFSYYEQIAQSIVNLAEKMTNNREISKNNRRFWSGGGFGIIGAIKGQIGASALNLGTSIVKEIEYAITDDRDRGKIRKLKENIFIQEGMQKKLAAIIYLCSFMTYYALLQILNDENYVSTEAEDITYTSSELEDCFESYLSNKCSYEEMLQVILNSINKNPFDTMSYLYLDVVNNDAKADIESAISFFDLEYIYKYAKEALPFQWIEEIKNISESGLEDMRKKARMLALLEEHQLIEKKELQSLKRDSMWEWIKRIKLLQEYNTDEIGKKIAEYSEVKKSYYYIYEPSLDKDLRRLKHKYAEKIKFEHIVIHMNEVVETKKYILKIVNNREYDLLWHEVEKQNGYAQSLLYSFYLDKVGKGKDQISNVEQIREELKFLDKKMNDGNSFAQLIYSAMVREIEKVNNLRNAEKTKIAHEHFLQEVNNAVKKGIVFAMYCYVDEMLYRESWNVLCVYMEESVKAIVPEAVSKLSALYSWKSSDDVDENFRKQEEEVCTIEKVLHKKEELAVLKQRYERQYIICPNCKNVIKVDKKFCSKCGTKVM